MKLSADAVLTMAVQTAEPGSSSHNALNLLASWAATLDPAGAANVMDGLWSAAAEPARGSWSRHRIHRSWHYGHAELGFARTDDRAFEGRWSWSQ
jgi:hypothetical protein